MVSPSDTDDMSSTTWDYDEMADVIKLANQLLTTFRVAFSLVTIIMIVGLVANGFVLFVILRSKKLRNTVYNVYIVSLCVSSFLFLLVWGLTDVITFGIYLHKEIFHVETDSRIRKLLAGCEATTMVVNCLMITALAVDRYIIIARPASLHNRRTFKNALVVCGIVWAVGFLTACTAIPVDLFTSLKTVYAIHIFFFIFTFAIPVVIIAVCFGLTVRAAATKRNATTLSPTGRRSLARKTRFLALIGGVTLSFFLCWGYWHGYYLAIWPYFFNGQFYRANVVVHIVLNMLTDILVLFNAALNPFLYALNRAYMKRHLVSFFTCGRKGTQAADMVNGRPDGMESTESDSVTPSGDGVTFNVEDETVAEKVPNTPASN